MTEKDAVRCEDYKDLNIWVVEITAAIDDRFVPHLLTRLNDG